MPEICSNTVLAFMGTQEWIIIGVIAVVLFGSRLPKIARSLGLSIGQFKKGLKNVHEDFDAAGDDDDDAPDEKGPDKDGDKSEDDSGEFSG